MRAKRILHPNLSLRREFEQTRREKEQKQRFAVIFTTEGRACSFCGSPATRTWRNRGACTPCYKRGLLTTT